MKNQHDHDRNKNPYATLKGGVIHAPNAAKDQPNSTVTKGTDLRNGKNQK